MQRVLVSGRPTNSASCGWYVYFSIVFCLFSVKVVLIPLGETGIRLDDFLILGLALCLLSTGYVVKVRQLPKSVQVYLLFVIWQLFSLVVASLSGRVGFVVGLAFVLRLLEYLVFFYAGLFVAIEWRGLPTKAFLVYFAILGVLVPGQILGVLPTFSEFSNTRASGNTNGPYELAVVATFGYQYFSGLRAALWVRCVALLLLVAAASRITAVAQILVICVSFLWHGVRLARVDLSKILLSVLIVLSCYPLVDNYVEDVSLINRINDAEGSDFFGKFESLYERAQVYQTSVDYVDSVFSSSLQLSEQLGGDDSGNIRVIRWATLMKSSLSSIDTLVFGLGPSFGSAAVDGYYVRVLIENGLVGLLIFSIFVVLLILEHHQRFDILGYVVVMVITAVFIDIFVSYKPMLLFWLWLGFNAGRVRLSESNP